MNAEQKIARLTLLVSEYLKYTIWSNVGITLSDDLVFVIWFRPVIKDDIVYLTYSITTFHVDDIDNRLQSFRNKINYEKTKKRKEYINDND